MTVAIIRHTVHGRRAYPIAKTEAEALVAKGEAIRHNNGLYEAKVVAEVEDHAEEQVYETKVMEADTPMKKRGRPRKAAE